MTYAWIWLSILAAFLQTLRTAAQRQLSGTLSTLTTTYVRALLGLPPMLAYLALVLMQDAGPAPQPSLAFLGWSLATALTQNAGTAVLLSLYRVSNFAVANQLARTDLVFTAIIGVLAFSEAPAGWRSR
jgi:drug/metabolite transporter (DMT)-like permease